MSLSSVNSFYLSLINYTNIYTSSSYDLEASKYINLTVWYYPLHILLIIQILSNSTYHQKVRDSENWAHLAAEFSTYASQFPLSWSLTGSTHNSEEKCDCQEVIKSKSQFYIKEHQNSCTKSRVIDSTDLQSPIFPPTLINITMFQHELKRPSLFDNMFISHMLIKAIEIKPLNKPEE